MTLEEFLAEWRNGDERLLVHTSGSTGKPKPLWVEKRRMEASARMTCDFLGLQEGDSALLCLPLDYIAGKMVVVRSQVRNLQLIAVEPTGHPLSTLSASNFPLSFAAMVPMQVWNSLQVPKERERLRQIRHLIIGGGAVDDALAEELKDFPHAVWSTYGMTETLSHIALRRLNGQERSDWYTPFSGVELSLNEEGCLVIDAPALNAGTLVTNDLAELRKRKEGDTVVQEFRILGRRDNVICTGGVKVQAEEVERKLRPLLDRPFLISKRKDEKFGEAGVLLVASPGPLSSEETEKYKALCASTLQKFERPRFFLAVDEIPMTETGKPARALAEQLISRLSLPSE